MKLLSVNLSCQVRRQRRGGGSDPRAGGAAAGQEGEEGEEGEKGEEGEEEEEGTAGAAAGTEREPDGDLSGQQVSHCRYQGLQSRSGKNRLYYLQLRKN